MQNKVNKIPTRGHKLVSPTFAINHRSAQPALQAQYDENKIKLRSSSAPLPRPLAAGELRHDSVSGCAAVVPGDDLREHPLKILKCVLLLHAKSQIMNFRPAYKIARRIYKPYLRSRLVHHLHHLLHEIPKSLQEFHFVV